MLSRGIDITNSLKNKVDMDKIEYRVETLSPLYHISSDGVFKSFDLDYLNRLGDEGWEVCAVDGNKYLLKRKIY